MYLCLAPKTGYFRGVKKWLAFNMIRGDPEEDFFSHGYYEERSKILYSRFKHPLSKIFQGNAFKKYTKMMIEEKEIQETSKLFFFLPSTTDRKVKVNKFFGNVNHHLIGCPYDGFTNYSDKNHLLLSYHLD